jgi:hypothetical protein
MPVSTDHLADDIKELRESQQNLADVMQGLVREFGSFRLEIVERLGAMNTGIRTEVASKFEAMDAKLDASRERTDAALTGIRTDFASKFEAMDAKLDASRERTDAALTGIRVEVAEKFGAISNNLEGFRGRTELALKAATWSVGILIPLFLSLVGCGFWISWYAGRLDLRVGHVESEINKEASPVPKPKAP